MSQVVGLGRAHSIWWRTVDSPKEIRRSLASSGMWWAWSGAADTGVIQLVTVEDEVPASRITGRARAMHEQFHDAAPVAALRITAPAPRAPFRSIGLVIAMAYDAEGTGTRSKDAGPFRHHFGDTDGKPQLPYPTRLLPALVVDAAGTITIRRRHGNIWKLRDWLIG